MRVVQKRFVVEIRHWPEHKSSESNEQLYVSRALQLWFVTVIDQFCSKVAQCQIQRRASVDQSISLLCSV